VRPGAHAGAEDNAVFYTFLVSCDNLGVPPLEWLTRTLEKNKPDMDEEQLKALLPCNYKADASLHRLFFARIPLFN